MNARRESIGKQGIARAGMLLLAALLVVGMVSAPSPAAAQGPDEGYPLRQKLVEDLIRIVTAGTGVSEAQLLSAVLGGQNLGQIIADSGADAAAISAQLHDAAVADITAAVTAGTLTQTQADKLLLRVDDVVARLMDPGRGRPNPVERLVETLTTGALVDEVVHQTGLSAREVRQALRDGQTLMQLTTENGGDPALVVSRAVERVTLRVNTLVERGRLTQTQADLVLNGLAEHFQELMSQPHPFRERAL